MLKRITFIILLLVALLPLLYIGGRYYVFYRVKKVIEKELANLEQQGIEIKLDTLEVGPWENKVVMRGVNVKFTEGEGKDTKVLAKASDIQLSNIDLLRAVRQQELFIRAVYINNPFIQTFVKKEKETPPEKKVEKPEKRAIQKFFFGRIDIDKGKWSLNENTETPVRVTTLDAVHLKDFTIINNPDKPFEWQVSRTEVSAVKVELPKDYYTFELQSIIYDADKKELNIDSIELKPLYSKTVFAKKSNKQVSRLQVTVPFMHLTKCDINSAPIFELNAQRADVQFRIESFRDMRYPFKNEFSDLPVKLLQKLPISLKLDTVNVSDSYVMNEEMPESGTNSGKVFFSKLNATIYNITSDKKGKPITMQANARIMGDSKINAFFTFSKKANVAHHVRGSLADFPLPKLNAILEPMAKVEIKSGHLNKIDFQFSYTDTRADGEVELNYNDLKMTLFQKKNPKKKSFFKTLLANMIVIKDNKDERVKEEKRTGTIAYERDKRRAIFNYWWKSVLSGIQDAM